MFKNKTKHIAWILVAILTISCFGNAFSTLNVNAAENNTQTMLRLFNPNTGEHLYTGDQSEKDFLVDLGWQYEGEAWNSPLISNSPVYRLYNKFTGEHHYTCDKGEKNWLISTGWNDEGIGWYSSDIAFIPVYREFNPNSPGVGAHNYTTDIGEHTYLITSGWNDEGIAWFGTIHSDESTIPEEPDIVVPDNFTTSENITITELNASKKDIDKLLKTQNASKEYLYAIINTSKMTSEDISVIKEYLSNITDKSVLLVDAAGASDAKNLYAAIKTDAKKRGGNTTGVQIFGTSTIVPTFNINYKALMYDGLIDEEGEYQTDLFYGNFNNAASDIADGYSVYDHLANEKIIRLTPKWPVVRLTLNRGEFKSFLDKYNKFVADTNLARQDIVNFSNPIFADSFHQDDMGIFLNRAHNEFGILDTNYRLYGNLKGDYPVETDVLGGFTEEEIGKENKKGSCEYIINSHGDSNNIYNVYFIDDGERIESFLNADTINNVLNTNPYYLDTWTCNNGYGMGNNLTTTALNGKCVGVFSATTIMASNGAYNYMSLEDMTKSNFYYFYYAYLKALNEGKSRSNAFFEAQKAYGTALYADTKEPLRGEGNVQFSMNNLLAYHNFGLIE